jgi:hypothetical protein
MTWPSHGLPEPLPNESNVSQHGFRNPGLVGLRNAARLIAKSEVPLQWALPRRILTGLERTSRALVASENQIFIVLSLSFPTMGMVEFREQWETDLRYVAMSCEAMFGA